MRGYDLIAGLSRKLAPSGRKRALTRNQLAKHLGMSGPALWRWKNQKKPISTLQVANLVSKAMKHARQSAEQDAIKPVVEFFALNPTESRRRRRVELFSPQEGSKHPYLSGLKRELKANHGIYIFYDSRGRALYAGKALRRSLWGELKSAFNRDRDVQRVKRVRHPQTRRAFRTSDEKQRQIAQESLPLHSLAKYVSAYAVPYSFINTLEALLVRGFANDLLNIRMERFAKARPSKRRKRRLRR